MQRNIYDPSFVRELFNKMSASYERMNFITSFGFSIIWRKQFLKKLGRSEQKIKVIDLLSGLGENWKTLIAYYPKGEFDALDFSEEMIKKSRHKSLHQFSNRIQVLEQDLLNNQLGAEEYDVVTCAFGLKTFNEEQLHRLAGTINRILKRNGTFSFIEISQPQNRILLFFYRLYLGKIIPILGSVFLGNPDDYKMLWVYTRQFKNSRRVKEIFEKNELEVHYESYFFGCATGVSGRKI